MSYLVSLHVMLPNRVLSRHDLVDKRFTSVDPEIGIRRVATNKDKEKLQKFGLYLNMYK
jgi:hypothetical protein